MTDIQLVIKSQLGEKEPFTGTLVAIDPGHTTGHACFKGTELSYSKQVRTENMSESGSWMWDVIGVGDSTFHPDRVVIEDYRIYGWRAKHHSWSGVHTARLIGAIEYVCSKHNIMLIKQSAQSGKGFWTDKKLKEFGMHEPGARHSCDAIRHGLHWLTFGYPQKGEGLHQTIKDNSTVG